MNNEEIIRLKRFLKIIPITFAIISVLFMYNGYKCLSGLIANNFDDFFRMFAMVLSYMFPVICFICFFYNSYIHKFNKVASIVYSSLTTIVSIFNLVVIFININFYISNNNLGSYLSLPSILNSFPYDAIATNLFLLFVQIYNFSLIIKPNNRFAYIKELFEDYNVFKLNIVEYLLLSILAILAFLFVGAGLSSFTSMQNALYDSKYIFLVAWVLLIPLLNLILLTFKFENRNIKNNIKLIILISGISINILFMFLVMIFEVIYPSYMVHIAKPIFMIAFSVSLPIEMLVILGIQLISTIVLIVRLILLILKLRNTKGETYVKN